MVVASPPRQFRLVLIKPSHYDNDGYVIQWFRSSMPSNSLAAVYGLATSSVSRYSRLITPLAMRRRLDGGVRRDVAERCDGA
jgi:hypothetical protein